ncbi:MAG TPA: hypothetical protein VIL77_11320 [Gaiellaceae bacterium]
MAAVSDVQVAEAVPQIIGAVRGGQELEWADDSTAVHTLVAQGEELLV